MDEKEALERIRVLTKCIIALEIQITQLKGEINKFRIILLKGGQKI